MSDKTRKIAGIMREHGLRCEATVTRGGPAMNDLRARMIEAVATARRDTYDAEDAPGDIHQLNARMDATAVDAVLRELADYLDAAARPYGGAADVAVDDSLAEATFKGGERALRFYARRLRTTAGGG